MRHGKSGRKFSRDSAHRQALIRNLMTSLVRYGRIETTEAKAKELRRWVDRLITDAKPDDVNARRKVAAQLTDEIASDRLFINLLPRLKERPGGFTRIIRKGPRLGDGAPMVLVELVD
ncbi:MAG: 50S ribosomal protein L17 [Candidatus Dormibacteria bacterium]